MCREPRDAAEIRVANSFSGASERKKKYKRISLTKSLNTLSWRTGGDTQYLTTLAESLLSVTGDDIWPWEGGIGDAPYEAIMDVMRHQVC
jgi:hypothetical protein